MLVVSAIGLALSGFILGLPFLIYGPKYTVQDLIASGSNSTIRAPLNIGDKATMNASCSVKAPFVGTAAKVGNLRHTGAFVIQMIGGIINGVAACPFWNIGLCFVDDMAGKRSGVYLGEAPKTKCDCVTFKMN